MRSHGWKALCSVVLVLAVVLDVGIARADSAAGSYVATMGGQQIVLQLRSDGGATLANETGSWSQQGRRLTLVGSDGSSVVATWDGKTIHVTIEGIALAFHRQGTATGVAVPGGDASRPFKPSKVLKGKRFKVPGYDASFTVPKGWQAAAGSAGGQEGIKISSREFPDTVIAITVTSLSSQQQRAAVSQLITQAAQEQFGDAGARVIVAAKDFGVNGNPAAQMILEATVGTQSVRGRVAGIRIGRWGLVFVGIYPAMKEREVGPAFETVLATFKGKAPKENDRLKAQLAGCWEHLYTSGGGSGYGSSTTRFRFDSESNYDYRHYTSVSVSGASSSNESNEAGTFSVFGNELVTESNKGQQSTYNVSLRGGMLFLGNTKYIPCS